MESEKWKMENFFRKILAQGYSILKLFCKKIKLSNFHFLNFNFQLFILICFILCMQAQVYAYEDCIITTDGKMTDIKIQHNDIIDVFPLITVTNDKNTIIVHPLKPGQTKFSIVKNNKDKFFFDVKVSDEKTFVQEKDGFEIFTIDCPPTEEYFELDEPPVEFDIDEPPILKERNKSD